MNRIMVIAIGFSAIALPALAQTSAAQLNAAELQRIMSGAPAATPVPPAAVQGEVDPENETVG